MDPSKSQPPLGRYFSGLAEYAFETRLGVADPPLVEYIAELLTRFVHNDQIYKLRDPVGHRLSDLAQMLVEAQARQGDQKREVHRHIGDFALFWAGVYPEALSSHKQKARFDFFVDYCQQGKRAYYIASTLRNDENAEESDLFERLSHEFDLCVYGLNEVRRLWEHSDPPSDGNTRVLL
jgi:hypothetical protein